MQWRAEGGGICKSGTGLYLAPYVVPAGGLGVKIVAARGPKGEVERAEASVDLTPGSIPGANECLGPNQVWSASGRDLDYSHVDELPEVLHRVPPEYPRSVAARHLSASLAVHAIVCRSGRVLDASVVWAVGQRPEPELEALAIAAVRQWIFDPARVGGVPVATTVAVPMRFPPP